MPDTTVQFYGGDDVALKADSSIVGVVEVRLTVRDVER